MQLMTVMSFILIRSGFSVLGVEEPNESIVDCTIVRLVGRFWLPGTFFGSNII